MTVDLTAQVHGILPFSYGGTGNDSGYAQGAYTPWGYYPAGFASGTTTPAFYGALLKVDEHGFPISTMTTDPTDRAIGVALGPKDAQTGDYDLGASTPADSVCAVAQLGVVDIYFASTASVGQFVIPSSTLGQAQAVAGYRKNAIGMVVENTAGGLTKVLLVNAVGSLSAGSNSDIGVSFFGDVAVAGSTGLMADAAHQHLREPDISAIITGTPVATASTAKVAHPASNVLDGNGSTYWESDGGSPITLSVDLGASPGARQILRSVIAQAGDALNKFTQYTLAYSDNGSSYTDVVTRTGQSNGVTDAYEFTSVLTHRYWRWTFGTITGNCQVYSIDLRSVPYGPIDSTTGKIPDAFLNSLTNPMTTQDDIIVGGASGVPGRLGKGSDGQVLTVDPSTHHLVWATPSSGLTNPMTTTGDIIYSSDNSGTPARLGIGSAGNVLTVASGIPSWAAAASGGNVSVPKVVQAKINGTGAITSITLPQAPVSGNTLLAVFCGFNTGYISSLACTNVTWTLIAHLTTSGGARVELYAGKVSGTGGTSITFTNPNSFMTAGAIEIEGATVGSTPTAGATNTGQLFTDLLGIASTTSGHLIACAFGIDNTSANNWASVAPTFMFDGWNLGRVGVVAGYSDGHPHYVQSNSNVAAAGGVIIGEIT